MTEVVVKNVQGAVVARWQVADGALILLKTRRRTLKNDFRLCISEKRIVIEIEKSGFVQIRWGSHTYIQKDTKENKRALTQERTDAFNPPDMRFLIATRYLIRVRSPDPP